MIGLIGGLIALLLPAAVSGQMMFEKVESRTNYGSAEEGDKGKLLVDAENIRFVNKNKKHEYFSIPTNSVAEVFYSRVSGRRIGTAILVSPLLLFSKGKKHYMTLSFDDGEDIVGAVEFKLDKKNYRGVLRAVEQVSGVALKFDQEGVKAEEEGFAAAGDQQPSDDLATIEISSEPSGAEIEVDGMFAGMTPRSKRMEPGEHEVVISLKGYKDWKKEVVVEAGEQFPISVQLEKD
jgi:hypothetical protein